jgi:X-Pro dipeptidyl-peptidase C-terminal non-catalytic domain
VQGLLGPWGHKYPFGGYPGPRIPWMQYTVTHWWDKWLKGKAPPTATDWPELPVWLSESQGPSKSLCPDEKGKWVAEDGAWRSRVKEKALYLGPGNRLRDAPGKVTYSSAKPLVLDTEMLETSSWGECGNDDLLGDQARFDKASLYFDSERLPDDLDIFGYPIVALTLSVNRPTASLSIRLNEIEPGTGASHLVTYRFYNLAYRSGDMASPEKVEPGKTFSLRVPLNIAGHTFKKGWRIRLSLSPPFYPTLWQTADAPTVTLFAGEVEGLEASALILPGREPRPEDKAAQSLLPANSVTEYVNPDDYLPTLGETRAARTTRDATGTIDGKPAALRRRGGLVHLPFARPAVQMRLEQASVLPVRLPGEVEQIAEQRHRADQKIDTDIAEHARERELRGAALPGMMHDEERDDAGHGVAEAGEQAEQEVEAKAQIGARHPELVVHHAGDEAHLGEPLLVGQSLAFLSEYLGVCIDCV